MVPRKQAFTDVKTGYIFRWQFLKILKKFQQSILSMSRVCTLSLSLSLSLSIYLPLLSKKFRNLILKTLNMKQNQHFQLKLQVPRYSSWCHQNCLFTFERRGNAFPRIRQALIAYLGNNKFF